MKKNLTIALSLLLINGQLLAQAKNAPKNAPKTTQKSVDNKAKPLCFEGKLSWEVDKKKHEEASAYCLHQGHDGYTLISQNCMDSNTRCMAKQASIEPIPSHEIYKRLGSPHFHLCHYLKGKPQFVNVWDKQQWIALTRCLFSDQSYIDLPQLHDLHPIKHEPAVKSETKLK